MAAQPVWKFVANLGDASPLEHGGYLIYRDETGVYPPEGVIVEPPPDHIDTDSPKARWTAYRFSLEPCTSVNGIVSDNAFHPEIGAWFSDSLDGTAETIDIDADELRSDFCADDSREGIIRRARAWRAVGEFHGFINLDEYPERYSLAELTERYPELAK